MYCFKTKPPAPLRATGGCLTANRFLCLNDPWSDEEDQLLIAGADLRVFKEVAQPWNTAQQRHLADIDRVVGLDHTTDDYRATVGDEHLSGRLLSN